jgi:hypothetical protein
MRNNDPIFYPSNEIEYDIKSKRDQNYEDSINILQTQWYQADLDQRFALGDQDIWGLIFPGVSASRKIFNFNIINPIVQAVSGFQRQSRKSTVCIPVQNGLQKTADQFTKCLYYVHNKSGAYQSYSDAFEQGALIQGLGLMGIFKDMTEDPVSGDIRLRYVDFKSILIDPYFRRHDLSDCRYIWTRQFFDREEAASLFPELKDKILSIPSGGYRDDKFYYMPEVYQIQSTNLVAFDEYWYLSTREANYLVDTETNEMQEFTGDEEDMRVVNMHFGGRLKLVKKPKQTVRRSILVNDKTLIDEENPYGIDRYPYVPFLGYFTPNTAYYEFKFRGIVRDMRDAQYLFNRRKVADLDILESQQQGLIIKKGTLVTPDDALNAGNGRILVRKENSSLEDIQPMQIIPPSPVMLQMEEMLMNVTHRIAGVDPSAMGVDVDDKAGIISMMRQAATARNLQRLFDQLDEAQKLCGEIIIEMIQKNWTFSKIRNVIGEEPTPEFDNKLFFKYGCKVIQANLTESQQQLELAQLLHFREIGIPVPTKSILKASTIQNKDELESSIMETEQQAQQQQQQMSQLQMQQLQVDNETKLAYAQSQQGLAAERFAKIKTDVAIAEDKIKRAHNEDTASLLNVIKAIKELEGMDLEHLQSKLDLLQTLQPEVKETPTIINQ